MHTSSVNVCINVEILNTNDQRSTLNVKKRASDKRYSDRYI